jgi:hypothetical protein
MGLENGKMAGRTPGCGGINGRGMLNGLRKWGVVRIA